MAELTEEERQRNNQNNTNNVRNAADVAIASGHPVAAGIGAAVKAADKVTGGKSSEAIGKSLTNASRVMPGGKRFQNASNKLNESGASDMMGRIAARKNSMPPTGGQSPQNNINPGGEQNVSLPSSGGTEEKNYGSENREKTRRRSIVDDWDDEQKAKEGEKSSLFGSVKLPIIARVAIFALLPFFLIILIIIMLTFSAAGVFGKFDDAFGINYTEGGDTGGMAYGTPSEAQKAFYERINTVKMRYQSSGKSVDSFKVVSVYHVINAHNSSIGYDDMTDDKISAIADAMFNNNSYSDETFKENLVNNVFPSYMPFSSESLRKQMADEVFEYMDDYYDLIGKRDNSGGCASAGSCAYNIKGFYIPGGAGNVSKNLQITDLKVRLMECGAPYGNGSYTKAIDQDLVPFEDYIAGVANAEIGSSSPVEAIKAQMVAARSYALSRPTAMGNALGKKLEEENGQWILQIASCVADQVFCNINEGCSFMGGGDGQGGICRSGKVPGAVRYNDPLPEDSQLRRASAETQGEVLVNAQGYVIAAGFLSTEQNKMINLAKQGLDYKQILMQVYNQGSRAYGATGIEKGSCNNGSSGGCSSTGDYAGWKQYEGEWADTVYIGTSGKTIHQIGCLATSLAILVAKSGVPVNVNELNPGTFVEYLNSNGGFQGGNLVWAGVTNIAPSFTYSEDIGVSGWTKQQKLDKLKELTSQSNTYVVAEVKGNTGQHWVAIDSVNGDSVTMMDPGSASTDLWAEYNWANTSRFVVFRAG